MNHGLLWGGVARAFGLPSIRAASGVYVCIYKYMLAHDFGPLLGVLTF